MPYYYGTGTQQNTNSSASTDTFLMNLLGGAASARAYLQKLMCGTYVTPADNAVRIRAARTSVLSTGGSSITPQPMMPDAPSAIATAQSLPTGATVVATPIVQLGFNQRGTAMWAAFNQDEAIGILSAAVTSKSEVIFDSQSTGTSVPVTIGMVHSE